MGDVTERTSRPTTVARRTAGAAAGWLSARGPLLGWGLATTVTVVAGLAGRFGMRGGAVAADDRAEMARAELVVDSLAQRAWMDETLARPRPALDDSGLVALGYVARTHVGVGSPFRLATFALRDPRLPAPLGRAVAWAVLARTARGATHVTDTTALSVAPRLVPAGRQHALIDATIDGAPDARTGELAVRIGYALAAAEGTVGPQTTSTASRLAALARDRRLAREDATRLLRAASAARDLDALTLLVRWRAERRFAVEQPLLGDALRPNEGAAVRAGIALRDALRAAAAESERRTAATSGAALAEVIVVEGGSEAAAVPARDRSGLALLLPPRVARRLADLPSVRGGPPQAPIAVATSAYGRQLQRGAAEIDGPGSVARRRFADRARSEETLVAELAIASQRPDEGLPPDVARVALTATVGMRPFAQDTLLPAALARGADGGSLAPTAEALVSRFGLRAVTFDATVPAAWRPYHLAQLAEAIEDLRAVLPWVDFDGLAVRVGESAKRDSALALHDPRTRTLYLPAGTGAGTIAHELAHDLDWQTARTRLAVRGAYSTDRALRDGSGALAASVRGLTTARPLGARAGPTERPAELFARGVDWFVATALAGTGGGRMNGALSAVQDEMLAGYAGVTPPAAGDGAADALVQLLADMTIVPAATRDRFLGRYGDGASPGPLALVQATTTASTRASSGAERSLRMAGLIAAPCVTAPNAVPHVMPNATPSDAAWRVALVRAAAESRARGMLRARGRRWAAPYRWSWEARATLGGPWSPALGDTAVARARDVLLRAVAWEDAARHPFAEGTLGALARAASACR